MQGHKSRDTRPNNVSARRRRRNSPVAGVEAAAAEGGGATVAVAPVVATVACSSGAGERVRVSLLQGTCYKRWLLIDKR